MIIVVLGASERRRDAVIEQLMKAERIMTRHLNITPLISTVDKGYRRLCHEFNTKPLGLTITIVSGITTKEQVDYLRKKKAVICHCYGQVSSPIYKTIKILSGDFHVLPVPLPRHVPDHIHTPLEVISECFFKG